MRTLIGLIALAALAAAAPATAQLTGGGFYEVCPEGMKCTRNRHTTGYVQLVVHGLVEIGDSDTSSVNTLDVHDMERLDDILAEIGKELDTIAAHTKKDQSNSYDLLWGMVDLGEVVRYPANRDVQYIMRILVVMHTEALRQESTRISNGWSPKEIDKHRALLVEAQDYSALMKVKTPKDRPQTIHLTPPGRVGPRPVEVPPIIGPNPPLQ